MASRALVPIATLLFALLSLTVVAVAQVEATHHPKGSHYTSDETAPPPLRDVTYVQVPTMGAGNASSGQETEMADDIPDEFVGMGISELTLWVAEWMDPWQDPVGIAFNIYFSECPPGQEPDLHLEFPWGDLQHELYASGPGSVTIYETTAQMPTPFEVMPEMSIGCYVITDWGTSTPYAGLAITNDYQVFGCGQAYWDGGLFGSPRWTTLQQASGHYADMAFGLNLVAPASVGDGGSGSGLVRDGSWGRIKALFD